MVKTRQTDNFYKAILFIVAFVLMTATHAFAQTDTLQTAASSTLEKALALRYSDPQNSQRLAQKALEQANSINEKEIIAETHLLLARLSQRNKEFDQSLYHFLQASRTFKDNRDESNYLLAHAEYADILLDKKDFADAQSILIELLEQAQKHGDETPIGVILMTKADMHYRQKQYNEAIIQYTHSLRYLTRDNNEVKKQLANTYKNIAQAHKRLKNRPETAYFYQQALSVYTALNDKKLMARTLNTLAEAERYLGNYVVALEYSNRGLELHKTIDDPDGKAKALMGAGIIYRNIARYQKSLETIHEAHLYYQKVEDISGIAKTSNQMGLIYTRLKQFDQARSFYQLTIELPQNEIDPDTIASAFREMAVIDLNAKNYETAMVLVKKAHAIYESEANKSKGALSARIIGNIYREQKYPEQAADYYRNSLALAKEIENVPYIMKAQTALAGIIIQDDLDQAVNLLNSSLALASDNNNKTEALYAVRSLLQAEKLRGNQHKALEYAEQQISLNSDIQKEKENREVAMAKANLHSHKIEVELAKLKEKSKLDQLELMRKSNEIEIAEQTQIISELELTKNKYASISLFALLVICFVAVVLIYKRFRDSKKRNQELDYLAARDPLTNCYNRRTLFELLNRDFADPELLDEFCIVMLDIDHFKTVNDTYGHSVGDAVIVGVANLLQTNIRKNDYVARYGGEEFCIVLPKASKDEAIEIAQSLRKKLATTPFDKVSISCSLGVSSIKCKATTPAGIIDQADFALYYSKSQGRNMVTFWDENLQS